MDEAKQKKQSHKEERKQITLNQLTGLGKEIIEDIEKNKVPSIKIPSRGTGNIVYDNARRYYVLGDRFGRRIFLGNVKQIRKLGQMVYVGNFCKDLVAREKTATIREMYYVSEGWGISFKTQQESNIIGEDLEVKLGVTREDLGLMPEEDGASVYGDITLFDETQINAAKVGKSGYTISPTIDQVEFIDHNVDKVLAVETMGMFHRLVQENAHKRFNCLIVGLKGQAARATRRFLKRVNHELGLPVYICNDGDPWGFHIAQVIISGSAKLAHVNEQLATPDAKFIGVTASDIINYDLPTDKLKDVDVMRLKELSKDPRYKTDFWQTEIKKMLKIGKKAEQQSFSKYGLEYVVDTYFPAKFEEMENQA